MTLYICDRKQCGNRCNPDCQHTTNIEHAKNFKKESTTGDYWEKTLEDEIKERIERWGSNG